MANTKEGWIYDLENRQSRRVTLGHERGAGAKCFHCKDQCPGLELHFWRKMCKSCKCGLELHDVPDDEDLRFSILFKDRTQNSKYLAAKAVLEYKIKEKQPKLTDKDEPTKPVSFEWVPAEVSPSLAIEYMNHLPADKIPISGSVGAEYRRIQLKKQLPLHDFMLSVKEDASRMREEKPEYKIWMEMVRKGIGVGKILRVKQTQFLGQTEECKMQNPQMSTNMKKVNHDMQILNSGLRNLNMQPNFPGPVGFRPIHPVTNYVEPKTAMHNPLPPTTGLRLPSSFLPGRQEQQFNNNVESSHDDTFTSAPFTNSDNSKEVLGVCQGAQNQPSRMDNTGILQPVGPLIREPEENDPNATLTEASNMDLTNATNNLCTAITTSNEGNTNMEAVGNSMPKEIAENHLTTRAMTCAGCKKPINFNTIAIFAEKAANKAWHPQCFVCAVCKEMLVDLVYFYYGKSLLCGRHYAKKRNICRCAACDELIFVSNWTMSGDFQYYHLEHFCCAECDLELAGHKYVLNTKNKGLPTCMDCYGKVYAKRCFTCGEPVKPEQQGICLKEMDWHATPECFKCSNKNCNKSLVNQRFLMIGLLTYCSKECTLAIP